jgi:hypothetical protein
MSNLWNKPNDELIKLAENYEIPCDTDNLNRKELIPLLISAEAQAGKLKSAVGVDEDGNELKLPSKKKEETFVVMFHRREGQPNYEFLGCNGCALYLPCDVKWRLPIRFMGPLKDAAMIKVVPNVDSTGRTKGVKTFKVPALNYTIFPDV